MQVWLWTNCAVRAEKSIDTLFILRTDKRFKDWKENSRCGRQSFSLASLDSSLYTREPDPSVGCADSSPCRGANGPSGTPAPTAGMVGRSIGYPSVSLRLTAPLTRGAFAGRGGSVYGILRCAQDDSKF